MKIIIISICVLFISKTVFPNNLFQSEVYELKFITEDINSVKEKKINEIKIKSFKNIIKKLLTKKNYTKIETNDINFINKFILNYKINSEKIINNNYYSKVKVDFNEELIIEYLINNKIQYVNQRPDKFLIIVMEKNDLQNHIFSKDNNFYKYLKNSNITRFNQHLILPNLDNNDRFIFNQYHFKNNIFSQNNLLNNKYNTEYQILVHSNFKNKLYLTDVHLFYNNKKYFISEINVNKINFEKILNFIISDAIDKWKEINQIDTNIINSIECMITMNNINELTYVRNLLKSIKIIQNLELKLIKLNENLYTISYFGNLDIFKKILINNRLKLIKNENNCNIYLI